MKQNHEKYRNEMLYHLSLLPGKIAALSTSGQENVLEFALHELCHERCLDINKAAYFVDNPDFDHCKGIAGFSRDETCDITDIWKNPSHFNQYMKQSPFHNQVCSLSCESLKRKELPLDESIKQLATPLISDAPKIYIIDLKHDNHGILVCSPGSQYEHQADDIMNWIRLLSLCPIH